MKLEKNYVLGCLMALTFAFGTSNALAQVPEAERHNEALDLGAKPSEKQTVVKLGVGATGNTGNTEAISGNASGLLELKRSANMFTLDVLGTLGYANQTVTAADGSQTDSFERNVANVLGRARYDYFLTDDDALFAALHFRRDIFSGIDARLQWQGGYMRNVFAEENHRFWVEGGFDITQDYYRPLYDEAMMREVPTPDDVFYSARGFLGYTNRLSDAAQFNAGIEFLYDVQDPENYRINANADLTSTLTDRFKLSAGFRMLYDNVPVQGAEKADTITTLQLVYSYDSLAGKEEPPACPPCEPPAASEAAPEVESAAGSEGEAAPGAEVAAPIDPAAAEAAPPATPADSPVETASPEEVEAAAPEAEVAQPEAAPTDSATTEEADPTPTE